MKFNLIKSFSGKYSIQSIKDFYILVDYVGISFLDKESLEVKYKINDFYNGITDSISHEKRYYMLGNISNEYRIYDLEKREAIHDATLNNVDNMVVIGLTEKLDGKSYYVFYSDPEFAFPKNPEKPDNVKIFQYSYPELKEEREVNLIDTYFDGYSSKMIDGYLLINSNGEIDYMDEEENITKHPEIQYNDVAPVFNEKRGEIYITSEYGLRIYDKNLIECNKFDIISDTKKEVNSPLLFFINKEAFKDKFNDKPTLQTAEKITDLKLLNENQVCALVLDAGGTYSRILIIDVRNGNIDGEFKIGIKASDLFVLDEHTIAFFVFDTIHIMRIEE